MKSKLYLLLFPVIYFSCEKVDCKLLAEIYSQDNFNIIVREIPIPDSSHNFYIKGKTITTNKDTIYDEENRWLCSFYNQIKVGDTIRMKRGKSIFNIHKIDTVLSYKFECSGKFYEK